MTEKTFALSAGAGKAAIGIAPQVFPLEGFVGQHDPLLTRVLVLDDGHERLALVVVELTSLFDDARGEVAEMVAQITRVEPPNVAVMVTHTFSTPHLWGPARADKLPPDEREKLGAVRAALFESVRLAATEAVRTLRPARIGSGAGHCRVNVNRDVLTADGWWIGANDAGPSDPTVGVVRIEDHEGAPVAILANYPVQSAVMRPASGGGDGQRLVSGDLAGAAMRHVESQYDDKAPALFLIGAAGDQVPYLTARRTVLDRSRKFSEADVGQSGFALVELQGERLGGEVVRVSEALERTCSKVRLRLLTETVALPAQVQPKELHDINPSFTYRFEPAGETQTTISALRIGEFAILGVRPELCASTGIDIRERSPFTSMFVATMFNGGAKYLADKDSYDRISYEAMNSRFARGSAEMLADTAVGLLKRLSEDEVVDRPGDREADV